MCYIVSAGPLLVASSIACTHRNRRSSCIASVAKFESRDDLVEFQSILAHDRGLGQLWAVVVTRIFMLTNIGQYIVKQLTATSVYPDLRLSSRGS